MKPDIHPKYYPNARVVCACGHTWTTGATQPELRLDICSNCHPFYTGEQRIVDTAGRVDRFRMRLLQKREKKVERPRQEKYVVVNPDEKNTTSAPAAAVAEAEAIVNEPAVAPVAKAPAAEAPAAEAEPEVMVRTVVEGGEAGERVVDDDEDGGARRAKTRKPRARKSPKPESTTGDGGAAPAAADSGEKA